jgi:hypothetical protein
MSEEFYDKEIAPPLMALAEKCKENNVPFLAYVEYEQEGRGLTRVICDNPSIETLMVFWAMEARGNIDSFMMAVQRHAQKYGHSSVVLSLLDVPTSPLPQSSTPDA